MQSNTLGSVEAIATERPTALGRSVSHLGACLVSVKLQRVSSQQQSTPLVSSNNKAQHQDGKRGAAVALSRPSDTVGDDVVREQIAADVQAQDAETACAWP